MKGKIALLAVLSTAVTVGSVYATWSFAEGSSTAANTTVNVAMTGVNSSTEKGTLSVQVMGANGFTLAVDDADNNHFADIKKSGVVTVTFTPAASASEEIKTNGVDVQCVISYAPYSGGPASLEEWTYDSKQIFNIVNDNSAPIILQKADASEDGGVFTWEIQAADIGIELKNDFFVDTLAKYTAMNTELAKGHFVLTVSEYTAP